MKVATVGVLREPDAAERRVAMVPELVDRLHGLGLDLAIERGAGADACFADDDYLAAGAAVVDRAEVLARADVVLAVGRPAADVLDAARPGQTLVGVLELAAAPELVAELTRRGVTAIGLEGIPRTLSRAQPMDVLTSQASIVGYKAVLVAASAFGRYFPMMITAAGTARPAEVLVLGVGVAGLQAIGTARRLGAHVRAYDVRAEARGEAESVGASWIDLRSVALGAGAGGYARDLTDDERDAQRRELEGHVSRHDVVITTARVPGRRPPVLVGATALEHMRAGSVVVDTASGPLGGNVEGSRPDTTVVTTRGVTVIGAGHLPSTMATGASSAYAHNVCELLAYLVHDGELTIDLDDEIQAGIVVTHDGDVATSGRCGDRGAGTEVR